VIEVPTPIFVRASDNLWSNYFRHVDGSKKTQDNNALVRGAMGQPLNFHKLGFTEGQGFIAPRARSGKIGYPAAILSFLFNLLFF
jgi:hypothetical protein